MLEYRVLGALRVVSNGEELHVGGPRQRRLLAALLLHHDEVVSTGRLVEAVFAGNPTRNAATTLRTYVLRLRRVVEDDGAAPVLVTEPPGYMLRVGPGAVDAAKFESLVAEGRARHDRGDPVGAAAIFDQALGLWSGEPYAEFAGESWVLPETQRLAQLRSVTEEQLVSAQLETGLAAELVPRLEAMVDREPLRESVRAQLMVALYRSGRQADALRVMRDYRDVLGSETGLDPSPELQDLEQRIIVHDERLQRDDTPGRVVRGYRLGERLGSGRDGTIHAARLPGVDRDLAIRVVPAEIADRPDVVRSFDATMRRVAALHHEAIVPIDDHWREPGEAYVVLRRMHGGTLRDRVRAGGLSTEEVVELARRVGSALQAAATAGIVHGRVIPESVLFDDSGAAHLCDFPLGTVDATPADDVTAFAALVHEAMTSHRDTAPGAGVLLHAMSCKDPPTLAELLADLEDALGATPPTAPPSNPYKGLRAFDEADVADFFGRAQLVDELVDRLGAPGLGGRLVLVVGASGSGKSSLVRAGLLPRVRAGAVPGSDQWLVTTMIPGATPFAELAASLARVATAARATTPTGEPGGERLLREEGIDAALREVVPGGDDLLLVIDQLEELFTLAEADVQQAFLDELVRALSAPDSRLRVVATLRADFYDRPLRFRRFGQLVHDATVTVPAMSAAQLEATIKGPADRVGLEVEPPLVAELVAAVVDQPAAMPSLQFTLYELAEDGRGRLDLVAYRQLGGVGGAIATRAENLYRSIDDGQDVVRHVFEQLLVIGPAGEPTRRPTPRSELARITTDRDLDEVIEPWVRARLLQRDRHPETREPTIEVAHEALLREWPRLRGWIEAGRAAIVAAGQLREAARSWESLDRDPGALYRGAQLETTLQQLGGRTDRLPDAAREFLDASQQARDQQRERETERIADQARTNRRLRRQLAALAVATAIAVVGGFVALDQRQQAQDDRRIAVARELASASTAVVDEDAELGLLLALEAVDRSRGVDGTALPEAERALHRAVTSSRLVLHVPGIGGDVDWHPDGTVFVTEGPEESGLVDLRDAKTGDSVLTYTGHDADVNDVAFSADGSLLATAGDDGLLRVWASDSGEKEAEVRGRGQVRGIAFSPDGTRVAAGWFDEGVVRVLDLTAGGDVLEVAIQTPPFGAGMSFGPDGQRLAVASWDGVFVLDAVTGEQLLRFDLSTAIAEAVAWSPDGRWIASASDGAVPRITDAATGELHTELTGHTSKVVALDWSADGSRLATGADDGIARVFEVTNDGAVERVVVAAREGPLWSVALSDDGDLLLTGDHIASAARVWAVGLGGGAEWANLPTSPRASTSDAAFTPDGEGVIITGRDEAAALWDTATGTLRTRLGPDLAAASEIEASPDGDLVATTSGGDQVTVWDTRSGEERFTVEVPGLIPGDVAWSPDGELLAVAGDDRRVAGRIGIADRAGELIAVLEDGEPDRTALEVAFSADGRWLVSRRVQWSRPDPTLRGVRVWDWAREEVLIDLPVVPTAIAVAARDSRIAAASTRGGVELWDPATGERLATLTGHNGLVTDVDFSSDGARVATSGVDGTVRLWEADSGTEQLVLDGHDGPVQSVAFGPNGDRLVSTGGGVARVWALDIDDLVEIARRRVTRSLTDAECRQYLHTERCPE